MQQQQNIGATIFSQPLLNKCHSKLLSIIFIIYIQALKNKEKYVHTFTWKKQVLEFYSAIQEYIIQ